MIRVTCVGAGLIGQGWAIVFARAGHDVVLYDVDAEALKNAVLRIEVTLADLQAYGLLPEPPRTVRARIKPVERLEAALEGAAYIQESVPERLEIKEAVYRKLDELTAAEAVLASSTSGLPASRFAAKLESKGRCLVAHPVNPPYLIPAVEVVPAPFTDPQVTRATFNLLNEVGQAPVVLKREIDGFVLNRLQGALLHEAFRLVEDGVADTKDVDVTVKHGLGLRWSFMGPFETIDLNAPGGISDYVEILGPMFLELARQRGAAGPWDGPLVQEIERQRRERLSAERLGERATWRDRRLMGLLAHKARAAREHGE